LLDINKISLLIYFIFLLSISFVETVKEISEKLK